MSPDRELLLRYCAHADQTAFAEIARRHVDLAYSAALRVLDDSALAQEVVQGVFADLARKAGRLAHHATLVGWLHTSVRLAALDARRREQRRRHRERQASLMDQANDTPGCDWAQARPLLDEAIGRLRERDHDVLLLRYFQNKSHAEVAAALGLSEEAVRKRGERALDRLRADFSRRGVTMSAGVLTAGLIAHATQAAPAAWVAALTASIPATATGAGAIAAALQQLLAMTTATKLGLAAALVAVAAIPVYRALNPTPVGPAFAVHRTVAEAYGPTPAPPPATDRPMVPVATVAPSAPARTPVPRSAGPTPGVDENQAAAAAALEAVKVSLARIGNPRDSARFDDATVNLVQNWIKRDPPAAVGWLGTVPSEGNQREHTTEALIAIETPADPELAFLLANSLASPVARANRINDVLKQWAMRDPAAAGAALQGAEVSDDDRARLQETIAIAQAKAGGR